MKSNNVPKFYIKIADTPPSTSKFGLDAANGKQFLNDTIEKRNRICPGFTLKKASEIVQTRIPKQAQSGVTYTTGNHFCRGVTLNKDSKFGLEAAQGKQFLSDTTEKRERNRTTGNPICH